MRRVRKKEETKRTRCHSSDSSLFFPLPAMTYFLDLLSNYKVHATTLTSTVSDHTATQSSDPAFQRSFEQLKTLLQRTADGHSIDGITQAVDNIFAAAREDDQLRVWFADVDTYVRKVGAFEFRLHHDDTVRQSTTLTSFYRFISVSSRARLHYRRRLLERGSGRRRPRTRVLRREGERSLPSSPVSVVHASLRSRRRR